LVDPAVVHDVPCTAEQYGIGYGGKYIISTGEIGPLVCCSSVVAGAAVEISAADTGTARGRSAKAATKAKFFIHVSDLRWRRAAGNSFRLAAEGAPAPLLQKQVR